MKETKFYHYFNFTIIGLILGILLMYISPLDNILQVLLVIVVLLLEIVLSIYGMIKEKKKEVGK